MLNNRSENYHQSDQGMELWPNKLQNKRFISHEYRISINSKFVIKDVKIHNSLNYIEVYFTNEKINIFKIQYLLVMKEIKIIALTSISKVELTFA
jgi:hypothetical protein